MRSVSPEHFAKVDYDVGHLGALLERAAALVPALPPDADIEVVIDEERSTSRAWLRAGPPWRLEVEGGAVEDPSRPRTVGEDRALGVFCRLLWEVADRSDPSFGTPPPGPPEDPLLRAAWDVHCYGRTARSGVEVHQARHRYDFRNRAGFSDAADAAFDRLWQGRASSWDDIVASVAGLGR